MHFSEVCGGNTSEAFQALLEQLTSNQTSGTLGDSVIAGFCGDNADIPQVFVAQYGGMPLRGFGECNSYITSGSGILSTEIGATDMTTTDDMMNPLESAVRDGIMGNGIFSSVLIQV